MSCLVDSSQKAVISGELGNLLELGAVTPLDDEYCKAVVSIRSDWFQASVWFEASNDRFLEFIDALDAVIRQGQGVANFINEEANFDLDIELTALGKASLRGVLCKNMSDELQLKYGFVSDRYSLEEFLRVLKMIFFRRC